jgi:archaellum component FlaF (FlaF/FlaG flagellin family)
MGIVIKNVGNGEYSDIRLTSKEVQEKKLIPSSYTPTDDEKEVRSMIIRQFVLGYQTMYKPRREFNDMSVVGRMTIDQMAFNTYQPNNGESPEGDLINGWRSNAIRPIVRNKCISIAAHATAQLIFPKVFAYNKQSDTQEDSARVMEDLMEWSAEQSKYADTSLNATIAALVNPASITYSEYGEVYRNVKRGDKDENGKWKVSKELDEDLSGFKDQTVPVDELFIENIYENDVQKQGWVIWRRVIGYDLASTLYSEYKNWQYIKPGVQIIYNDVNTTFYESYDTNMRSDSVEVVYYWSKKLDVKLCVVNGVLLSDFDNPNPRMDKLYPFTKFGYENVDEGKFFYYKSLAFKMQSDANIVNTLYPMIIDGTYLNIFQPMVNIGSETIGSDVIIPGGVTTLTDPNSKLTPIAVAGNIKAGMDTLMKVEESVSESSEQPTLQGDQTQSGTTAYEISRMEQNANTVLGLFIKMIAQYVRQYGRLRLGDIIQHLTIVDVDKITDDPELVYRSFLVKGKGKDTTKKIEFTDDVPEEPQDESEALAQSYKVLSEQKRIGMEIWKANPTLFRELIYRIVVSPDVLHPRSEDLERAMNLELYDRAIMNPMADQEAIFTDFLLGSYKAVKDPDDYVQKQPQGQPSPMQQQQPQPGAQPSPMQGMMNKAPLPNIK